jgi:dynein heavy chain
MLFSPFKKPFEARIMEWFNTLKRISDILEEWAKLQMNWMYLQPIFDSPDIAKQLHKESKNFKFTDNFWRAIISRAKESPNVMKICQIEDLLDKIKESNNSLDLIQKSLNNYLESKRAKFARFYFLSNN